MASPFSGVLQLTDLDDFIGPSQVGRPRASRAGGGTGPGHAQRETSPTCVFLSKRPDLGPRVSVSLLPFLPTQTTEARESWAASSWTPRYPGGISRSYGSI